VEESMKRERVLTSWLGRWGMAHANGVSTGVFVYERERERERENAGK